MEEIKQAIVECAALQAKNPGFATYIDFSEVVTAFESLEQTNQDLARENAALRGLSAPLPIGEEQARG